MDKGRQTRRCNAAEHVPLAFLLNLNLLTCTMFGIGLPELILILALALIVVGPEKLPDLAKSLAKQLLELKKTANALKDSLQEELKAEEREAHKNGAPAALPLPAAGIAAAKSEQDEEGVIDVEARPAETVTPAGDGTTAADAEGGRNQPEKKS